MNVADESAVVAPVAVRSLSFRYQRGAPPVVDDVTLDVPSGVMTALTGPSGSGKSTLLYLLALMIRPTSGEVVWDGRAASRLPDAARSRLRAAHVGFVFQDALLDPSRTVLANVCDSGLFAGMTARQATVRARALLGRFGVSERADHRPGEISGGQAQRAALCRALLTSPRVIFADEPTGNLDDTSADVVMEALAGHAAQGGTVIVATHDKAVAARCPHEIRLAGDGGVTIRDATPPAVTPAQSRPVALPGPPVDGLTSWRPPAPPTPPPWQPRSGIAAPITGPLPWEVGKGAADV